MRPWRRHEGEPTRFLIECESILGGTSTNAWVHTWEPTAGGNGIPREIYERMRLHPLGVTYPSYDEGAPRAWRAWTAV